MTKLEMQLTEMKYGLSVGGDPGSSVFVFFFLSECCHLCCLSTPAQAYNLLFLQKVPSAVLLITTLVC